jgi:hypothetical protein
MTHLKKWHNPNQVDLFEAFEGFIATFEELTKTLIFSEKDTGTKEFPSTTAFHILVNEAVKSAVHKSDLSRDQVVDKVNAVFNRPANGERPLGLAMFNNYLSDAKSEKLPLWVVVGASLALDDPGPLKPMVEATGHTLISEIERIDLEIGRHECAQWELARSMATLRKCRFELDQKGKDEKSQCE